MRICHNFRAFSNLSLRKIVADSAGKAPVCQGQMVITIWPNQNCKAVLVRALNGEFLYEFMSEAQQIPVRQV
jgi:hypothetical protein